jgi:hypothetical protein
MINIEAMNRISTFGCWGFLTFAIVAADPAAAQSRELARRLEAATRLECKFTIVATGDWNRAESNVDSASADLEAVFYDINVDEGTAEADSQFGVNFIVRPLLAPATCTSCR